MYRCPKCSRFLYYGLEHECKPAAVTVAELNAEIAARRPK